jgi:hypothetical protein
LIGTPFFYILMFCALTLITWWISTRAKPPLWIPILGILHPNKPLLRFTLKIPPLFSFLCFNALLGVWVYLSLKPDLSQKTHIFGESSKKVHIFLDLSPSIGIHTDLPSWIGTLAQTYDSLPWAEKTISTSLSPQTVLSFPSKKLLLEHFKSNPPSWQRQGVQLGEATREFSGENLLILSDRDLYSWRDFQKNPKTKWVPPPSLIDLKPQSNLFLEDIQAFPEKNTWHIKIESSGQNPGFSGQLGSDNMTPWVLPQNQPSLFLQTYGMPKDKTIPILWELKTDPKDSLLEDNWVRVFWDQPDPRVLLVGETEGEEILEEPSYKLRQILESLGAQVNQTERPPTHSTQPIWMVFLSESPTCPTKSQGLESLWLFPKNQDFESLCRCGQVFLGRPQDLCQGLSDERDFQERMARNPGGNQVGGSLGESNGLAWSFDNRKLILFTRAPVPDGVRFSHGKVPFFLQELLQWQGYSGSTYSVDRVVRGESLLETAPDDMLPELWDPRDQPNQASFPKENGTEDRAKNIIFYLSLILLLEALGPLLLRFWPVALFFLVFSPPKTLGVTLPYYHPNQTPLSLMTLKKFVEDRTSVSLDEKTETLTSLEDPTRNQSGWLWISGTSQEESLKALQTLTPWIKRGGFLILEGDDDPPPFRESPWKEKAQWLEIPRDHELTKSFYLLETLPSCDPAQPKPWRGLFYDRRLTVLLLPKGFLQTLSLSAPCPGLLTQDMGFKAFTNILMAVFTTDYKKDQIHVQEIIKRLRKGGSP